LTGFVKGTSHEEIKLKSILTFIATKIHGDIDSVIIDTNQSVKLGNELQQPKLSNADLIK